MIIGTAGYGLATLAFLALSLLLTINWLRRRTGLLLLLASLVSVGWALVNSISLMNPAMAGVPLAIAEYARLLMWCWFLVSVFNPSLSDTANASAGNQRTLRLMVLGVAIFVLIVGVLIPANPASQILPIGILRELVPISWLLFSITGLILVEQLLRNATGTKRDQLKPICLALGSLFAFDFFMFSEALLFKALNATIWNARGYIAALAVPLIAMSASRHATWKLDVHVSRSVVTQSFTLIASGLYLLGIALAGYSIRYYGTSWGEVLSVVVGSAGAMLLAALLLSSRFRTWLQLFFSKNFFSHKYDYRLKWLQFTDTLSTSDTSVPQRITVAMCDLVDSRSGALWVASSPGHYELASSHRLDLPPEAARWQWAELLGASTQAHGDEPGVIHLGSGSDASDQGSIDLVPPWFRQSEAPWILVPLPFKDSIVGFVVLSSSPALASMTWEDEDLLSVAGRQGGGFLAQYLGDLALMDAKQFEAFHKLSAYIAHDLKNILNQQSMIVSNAARHKSNPAFVDDVINTVAHSVDRMTRLMDQLRSGSRDGERMSIDLKGLLEELIEQASRMAPAPTLDCLTDRVQVSADRDQLSTVFGHLLQNAQEASNPDDAIDVQLDQTGAFALVTIRDTGHGMSEDFIREQLFKPFSSTKGLTGMGIGAYESREFVRSLGGEIRVESAPGKWTVFTVQLPVVDSAADVSMNSAHRDVR